jgi:eukaryotic-like serine/threonine-protein kinase
MTTSWRDALQQGLGTSYRIRQELGGGGMSATYIADETALGRPVVLKALPPELAAGLNAERFEREIHLAARLQHAFIVPLLSAGTSAGVPWYTMPLVQGESLRARLSREGALTPVAAARLLRDVAEALAYAHAQGVVHRDIKPDNVLLAGAHALVTDFGVAKAVTASTAAVENATGIGMALGTPAYMAPEQAAGDPTVDHRADLYALGAMAYEMVTAHPPFTGSSPAQVLAAHMTQRPEPLARRAPGVPRELAQLVEQLLAKHPNDRPSHAQAVADSLGTMLTRWSSGDVVPSGRMTFVRALSLWAAAFAGVAGAAWLAVRWLPVPEWTFPAAILVMLAGLPVLALTAWLHRPARMIAPVPSVSSATTVGRIEAIARPRLTWRWAGLGGVLAVAAVAMLAGAWGASRALGIGPAASLRATGAMGPTDRVFIADFEPPASDSGLGDVVTDLLATEIGRSASIPLVDPTQRAFTLTALGLPPKSRIREDRAREFATRANAKVYLAGAVTAVGKGFLLRATLHKAADGTELERFRQQAGSADDIIPAVDRLGRQVRERLGATLSEVRGAPVLYWAVTPSLDAARDYTEGVRLATAGDQEEGLRLLERAVSEDSTFAMAYRTMASFYTNLANPERAAWAAERAFRYKEKLPNPVQLVVEGTYYSQPVADYDIDKAITAYEASHAFLNNLALLYRTKREFEKALSTWREAIKSDTTSQFTPVNINTVLWATGRKEEARQHIARNVSRWLPSTWPLVVSNARLASADLFVDSSAAILQQGLRSELRGGSGARATVHTFLAVAERTRGRISIALQHQDSVRILNPGSDTVSKVPPSVLYRANILAWDLESPADARRLLDSIAAAHPPGNAGPLAYRWLELAQAFARAGDPGKARVLLSGFERKASDGQKRRDRQQLELTRGEIAIAEKRYADAISAFRTADVGFCTICALAPLARAYDLEGNSDSAIAVFERYLTTNYYFRSAQDQTWLAGTYKRLGELYEAKGDVEKARTYYARFVDLWKNADAKLQPKVTEVRRRLAALPSSERKAR